MFKRSQQEVNEGSKHWYQDRYQHVLTQRNILALVALLALLTALVSVFIVMAQKVDPVSRQDYAASEAVDRYFTSMYMRVRESYNFSILRYNYNLVRLMSTPEVFYGFRRLADPGNPDSLAAHLQSNGQRDIKIKSLSYISNPLAKGQRAETTTSKIMQARITTTDTMPNQADVVQQWVVTVTFEYANLNLNEAEQLLNPLGYSVTSYQIHREIN